MDIFIRLAGVQLGPYSEKQVQDYLTEGLLSENDQAMVEGTGKWVTVTELLATTSTASLTATVPVHPLVAESATDAPSATSPEPESPSSSDPEQVAEEKNPDDSDPDRRAPDPAAGVTHLPSRTKESGRVSLPSVVEALSKKTIMIGPSGPPVPASSGRTRYSVATTTPLTQTAGTKKLSRSAMVKALSAQTAPLPTKTLEPVSKEPPVKPFGAKAPPTKIPSSAKPPGSTPSAPMASPTPLPASPPEAAAPSTSATSPDASPVEGLTPGPGQADQSKPRERLLKSLTAKTVPMRTTAAPPLQSGSGNMPVTSPLPTRAIVRPPSGAVPPPSVVSDLTKKLAPMVQPDPVRAIPPKKEEKDDLAAEVETVKIPLPKVKAPDKATTSGAITEPVDEEDEESVKPPPRKRSLTPLIFISALLAVILVCYVWSPYIAASQLQAALSSGDSNGLNSTIDFDAVRASLKDQVQKQLSAGISSAAMSDATDMLDKSIDLFVTPEGISGLGSKEGTFTESQLASTISFATASKLFLGFNNQPVQSKGLDSIFDFAMAKESALVHLQPHGLGWKMRAIELRPALLNPPSPDQISPLLSPVVATYLERGDAEMKKTNWKAASDDYSKAIGIDPQSSVAYNARGTALQSKGDLDDAMKDYTHALTINPQMAEAYEGRGNVKAVKNDLDGAIADYTQAIKIDPKRAVAYDGRGNAKTAKDDIEGAIADYTQAIGIDPTLASAYSDRGFARQSNGNLDGAIADYTQALALKPKTAVAYYNRGLARQSQGNLDAAIVDYDRALAFDPKLAGAYFNRGNAKNATHDYDGAIADYTSAINLNPKLALAYCYRGVVRQAKGDLEGAITDYTQALEIDPKIAIAYYNRGRIKQLKNDPDGAIADSSQALDLDPKNSQAYFNRGFAKLSKGNLEGAFDDLKLFCDFAPRDHDTDHARLYLWLIAKAENNPKIDADELLSDALENNWNASPEDPASKTAAFLLGRTSESDYLSAAAGPDGKNMGLLCEAWYFAGMKRLLIGDRSTAIDYFHKCLATGQADYCEFILAQSELKSLEAPPPPVPQPASPPPPPRLRRPERLLLPRNRCRPQHPIPKFSAQADYF